MRYDAVIAADGLNFLCRSLTHGSTSTPVWLGDVAYHVIVEKSHALESEAVDGLVAERTINVWLGPDTHIVL